MTGARRRALLIVFAVLLAGMIFAVRFIGREPSPVPSRPAMQRPVLLLLTSLPLLFSEDFSLRDGGSPALARLRTRYKIVPISVTDPSNLGKGRLLLMAQPIAQTAENLVALDKWFRCGGRVLLLADPMLEWPSKRPLGDLLRPPAMFMDTGLLAHWGLTLDSPDERGPADRKLDGYEVLAVSPGTLRGSCETTPDGLVGRCHLGKGKATVIADADLLDVAALGGGAAHNLDAVLEELAKLERD